MQYFSKLSQRDSLLSYNHILVMVIHLSLLSVVITRIHVSYLFCNGPR